MHDVSVKLTPTSYNLRQKYVEVFQIGIHRAIAVTAGILWAALVSRFWWPAEARRELSKSLSEFSTGMRSRLIQSELTSEIFRFCSNLGWLYTRLVASNSFLPEYRHEEDQSRGGSTGSSRHIHLTRLSNSVQEFMAM